MDNKLNLNDLIHKPHIPNNDFQTDFTPPAVPKIKKQLKLKPLKNQVIVITGASSGIGLATAKMAAKRGAKVVISSRNLDSLNEIAKEIREHGGQVMAIQADVSVPEDMENLRDQTLQQFGCIDTWINNAGVSIFGALLDVPEDEERQVFETNFWGIRNGSHAAVSAMSQTGGAIINIGSEVSELAIPQQGIYSAAKHAVKAYTDALRMDVEHLGLPISVTLVRPAAIDTPFTQHAKNHLVVGEPSLSPPVYHPNVVARAILYCASHPRRDVYIGLTSKGFQVLKTLFPRTIEKFMEQSMYHNQAQGSDVPHLTESEALMKSPKKEGEVTGGYKGYVQRSSLYTQLTLHPVRTLLIAGVGIYAGTKLFRFAWPAVKKTAPMLAASGLPAIREAVEPYAQKVVEARRQYGPGVWHSISPFFASLLGLKGSSKLTDKLH